MIAFVLLEATGWELFFRLLIGLPLMLALGWGLFFVVIALMGLDTRSEEEIKEQNDKDYLDSHTDDW